MTCRMFDMRRKEVINIKDGMRLGSVSDIEFDTTNARVVAVVIYGRLRLFGLLGREDDIVIRWQDIQVIGDDTILVSYNNYLKAKNSSHSLANFLGFK
ncbi:PRC-barrel domain protein [Caprobacter fermentans]|uniref:PRC-barrel domain protein n=1 Tax=Caproicibacter fermentans TaxID=2576756 RepID=A0A6N8I1A2_9FIRM|nr:YlmC/YmxH family sporulation protein [Caproicibacter fermentans]MVB11497.1 PRC-barrel domain protein [Caproicibacter fermentans]OCN02695.1 sporulation protein, YlmC/YmxH family [Clostridium sp. W14A]QNK41012.1 YlmC/YmxH family sporulation protein [Caproicibacter fermentans]